MATLPDSDLEALLTDLESDRAERKESWRGNAPEKARHRDVPFDSQPLPSCPLAELNRLAFEQGYLPRAVAPDILDANDRSYEQRLASTGMIRSIDEPVPTVVGVLTLAKSPRTWIPGAYIQFLRIQGTEWGDPVLDEQEIDGTLETMLRRLDEKLKAHNTVSVDFTSGTTTEIRRSLYPLSALQQLARNAVLHRAYEGTHTPIRVYWFNDRIEIISPGGPYGSITRENFGEPGHADYRNPNIAAVLRNLGLVQRFGFGISEARRALRENGNPPPEFKVESTTVAATIRSGKRL